MYSLCILIYVSMYIWIYIATHLQTGNLAWQQAVQESNSNSAYKYQSSNLRETLPVCNPATIEKHLEAVIMRTWRAYLGEFRDTHDGVDWASLETHLEAMIKQVCRGSWTPSACEHGGRNQMCSEICTWRLWSCNLGGHNQRTLKITLEAVIERVWRCTWRL